MKDERIIVALDVNTFAETEELVRKLSVYVKNFKVGLELLTRFGAKEIVNLIHSYDGEVFYDGKFDDIPNTVGRASKAVADMNVKMFNVHASAGIEAMESAVKNKGEAIVLAVTVLTSLKEDRVKAIFGSTSKEKVLQFAKDAKTAGCDGIICSPKELEFLKQEKTLNDLIKVTPGVRPTWASKDDQSRSTTPKEALNMGANYLVIGRPITMPPEIFDSPVQAVVNIIKEME